MAECLQRVVLEVQLPRLEAHQGGRLVDDRVELRAAAGDPVGEADERQAERADQRHAPDRGAQADRRVDDRELAATAVQEQRHDPAERTLLVVEPLQQVDEPDRDEQHDGHLHRPAPALEQVRGDQQQRGARRQRQRVEDLQGVDALELEQQVPAPADVRRQRRGDVDDAGQRRQHGSRQRQATVVQ